MAKDFYIKNMVCDRCIKVLPNEIEAQGMVLEAIELGHIQLEITEDTVISLTSYKTEQKNRRNALDQIV